MSGKLNTMILSTIIKTLNKVKISNSIIESQSLNIIAIFARI
jgi:hypothetical protein